MNDTETARIYLMAQRKNWHHDVPSGWKEVAWKRFDFIECAIYEKPVSALTANDREWLRYNGSIPKGWIDPS